MKFSNSNDVVIIYNTFAFKKRANAGNIKEEIYLNFFNHKLLQVNSNFSYRPAYE